MPSVQPEFHAATGVADERQGCRVHVRGVVQGVGFRPWVYRAAVAGGITGRVWNDSSGVYIDAFGASDALTRFLAVLRTDPPAAARIASIDSVAIPADGRVTGFSIVHSERSTERVVSIPPDLATCDACLGDIADPANRRHGYPFTNCTNCGPRFTIATDIPYDRAATTMAPFAMCDACRLEYENVDDRRFHAQPNACPDCGPQVFVQIGADRLAVADPVSTVAAALRSGLIAAIKGLGGVHLACDATSAEAVARLRQRKHRDEKPFAVMVRDLCEAERLADLDAASRGLLTSVERPIVLVPKRTTPVGRGGEPLAPNVAPRNRMVGLFLPYTPLHHLLLAAAGCPLVMTSANLSDEPIVYRNADAIAGLSSIADLLLLHDREIETRCDDSVAAVIDGRPRLLRRSRGYVPRALSLRTPVARPVLACGALLKNTFALAAGAQAWLGPHIGDLENVETFDAYTESVTRFERFLQVTPAVVAHDLHPDYMSTRFARQRGEAVTVGVQHHHAHVASVMAEHGIDGPVIGVAYDGTGYGPDGTMWGGEVLVAGRASFVRAATWRPIPLAGGDRAIREPWRIAYALLLDAFGDVPPDLRATLAAVPAREAAVVETLIARRFQAPLAHGVGRYFDGFGALFLGRHRASYEGQVALEWHQAADGAGGKAYPFAIDRTREVTELDLRPMMRAAVTDYRHGTPVPLIAAAFHTTVAAATARLVREVAARFGRLPVVASGGCFQNARLATGIRAALVPEFEVWMNEAVPAGDGGIALGQAVVADAVAQAT